MQINLKDKLRSLRLQKNITQEALANHLGITPQSVGKWERGEGFPDITLLPRIAFYFDITVDELLCVDQVRVEEAIAEYERQAAIYQKNGENEKNLELWEQAYAEFPNDCRVIEGLMFAINRDAVYAVIGCMANMEDDEHIDAFLDAYASREDMSRSTLLFNRYKMREELDKIEPVRQYILWMELSHIISAVNDWQVYLCDDPNHFIWFCETQLHYLNAVNNLFPDRKHLISGGTGADLWCEERIELGIRYTASFAKLKKMNEAYDAFEDTLRVIEQIISVTEDEFKIGCSSPALKGFTLECEINWIEKDGKEYKEISMLHNDWWNWIVPLDYQKVFKRDCFDIMRADKRFDSLFERLDKCVICRELQTD